MDTSPDDSELIETIATHPMVSEDIPQEVPALTRSSDRTDSYSKPLIPVISGIMIIVVILGFTLLLAHRNGSHAPAIGTTSPNATSAITNQATTTSGITVSGTPGPTTTTTNGGTPLPSHGSTPPPSDGTATPSPTGTITPNLPYASTATVSVLTTTKTFGTEFTGDGIDVLIDPSGVIRVATDGTGQVAAFVKNFQVNPGNADQLGDQQRDADYVNGEYVVPDDCATQAFDINLAHENATFAIAQAIYRYRASTNSDAQVFYDYIGSTYITTLFDDTSITCTPAPGYHQATRFSIGYSMKASAQIPLFTVSSVLAYRHQQASAKAPANFAFGSMSYCSTPYVNVISATVIDYTCNVTGVYYWKWNTQVAHDLASLIAGKDPTTAEHILSTYPGAYVLDNAEFQPFALTGGSYLPIDPSKIAFKVYPGSLNGIPTGTPTIYS